MIRRFRVGAAVLLAATLAVTASGCSGSGDDKKTSSSKTPDKVSYLTAFGAVGRDAFAWVAQDKGYFKEANLDVTINLGAATGENLKALAGGQAQFVNLDAVGAWILAGKGEYKDARAIMSVHQQNLVSIITLEGNGITSPKDLEGKKIGAATGSVNQLLWPAYAKLAGVDQSKVQFIAMQTTQLAGALANKQVDALSIFLLAQKSIEKAALGKKPVVMPYSTYMSDLYGNAIFTSTKIAKDNPDLAKRFRGAMLKALKYTVEHPQEAADIMKKAQPASDVASALSEITLMTPYVGTGSVVGTFDEQRVARAIATLQGSGLIGAGLTPKDAVDFSIAPKV